MTGIVAVEPPKDAEPKRGRGRPRKDPSDTTPRTRRASNPAVTEDAVGGLLVMVNIPLAMLPWTAQDALEPDEITALAKGIVEQSKSSPAFKRYVQYALKASGATGLLAPLSFILARRAIRHGFLPGGPEADAQLGQMVGVLAGTVSLGNFMPMPSTGNAEQDLANLTDQNDNGLHPPIPFAPPQPVPGNGTTPAGSFTEPID